jgi:hypothetical protein
MKKLFWISLLIFFISNLASAQTMNDSDKSKALDCVGIYMANYFLPSGEKFEYAMKEKSISTVKVLKTYALQIGIPENEWDEGVNKATDKHYGSKYDEKKTDQCHAFVEALIPNGAERVKKVIQTLY